jgi:hypothetical protein
MTKVIHKVDEANKDDSHPNIELFKDVNFWFVSRGLFFYVKC